MNLLEIRALLRRHLLATVIVCIFAAGATYRLEYVDPSYQASGSVAITASQTMEIDAVYTYARSLLAVQDLMSVYLTGPAAERAVRAAGGAGSYSVTLTNQSNEELPYYKDPYLNIITSSPSPQVAASTFTAVANVLEKEVASVQAPYRLAQKEQVTAILASQPRIPVSTRGSRVRSFTALAILTVIAVILAASALDRRNRRRRQWSPGEALPSHL